MATLNEKSTRLTQSYSSPIRTPLLHKLPQQQTRLHLSKRPCSLHSELDPNTTSQILRNLQAKNLIERVQIQDQRSKSPILTNEGQALLKKAIPRITRIDTQFFNPINLKSTRALTALQKLAGY